MFTNYGRPDEQRQVLTLRLDKVNDMVRVGTVEIGGSGAVLSSVAKKDLKDLEKGMSPREVTEALGAPPRTLTDGVPVYEYRLSDGGPLSICRSNYRRPPPRCCPFIRIT